MDQRANLTAGKKVIILHCKKTLLFALCGIKHMDLKISIVQTSVCEKRTFSSLFDKIRIQQESKFIPDEKLFLSFSPVKLKCAFTASKMKFISIR